MITRNAVLRCFCGTLWKHNHFFPRLFVCKLCSSCSLLLSCLSLNIYCLSMSSSSVSFLSSFLPLSRSVLEKALGLPVSAAERITLSLSCSHAHTDTTYIHTLGPWFCLVRQNQLSEVSFLWFS